MITYRNVGKLLMLILLPVQFYATGQVVAQVKVTDPGDPIIRTFGRSDIQQGSAQFWGVTQDTNGVLYFGNSNYGMQQYDGENWRVIPTPGGSQVRSFAMGNNGRIYAGSSSDFGYLARDSLNRVYFNSLLEHLPDSLKSRIEYFDQVEVLNGNAYFSTSRDLFRWDGEELQSRIRLNISGIARLGDTLFVNTADRGLYKLEGDSLKSVAKHFKDKSLREVLRWGGEKIWVTEYSGLFRGSGKNIRRFSRIPDFWKGSTLVEEALKLGDGNLALACSDGLRIIEPDGTVRQHLTMADGLSANFLHGLHLDKAGRLWVTSEKGVNVVEYGSPVRILYDAEKQQLNPNNVYLNGEHLLVATDDGYLKRSSTGWEKKLAGLNIHDFAELGESLLVAHSDGLMVGRNENFEKIGKEQYIFRFIKSNVHSNTVYYNAPGNGIGAVELKDGGSLGIYMVDRFKRTITTLVEDKQGRLWYGTGDAGIYRKTIEREEGRLHVVDSRHYTHEKGLPDPAYNYTTTVGGEAGFITKRGLYRLNENGEIVEDTRFKSVYRTDDSRSWPVSEDRFGRVWIDFGSSRIVKGVPQQGGRSYRFVSKPYERLNNLGDVYFIRAADSLKTIFSTTDYVVQFDERNTGPSQTNFKTLITGITLAGDSVLADGHHSGTNGLPNAIRYTNEALRFNWTAATYYPDQHVSYRYRLKGLDPTWSDWKNETYRDFNNLPEGRYTFEVQGRNIYETVGQTASMEFVILPPWYRTIYAYIGYFVIGGLGIFGLIRLRERRARRQREQLEAEIEQRTAELQQEKSELEKANRTIQQQSARLQELDTMKNDFFANISHELRTPLTLIQGPVQQLKDDYHGLSENAGKQLELVELNAQRLQQMVERILELTRLQNGTVELELKEEDIGKLVEQSVASFESLADREQIVMELDMDQNAHPGTLVIDRRRMEQVLNNLLSNAIKFTDAGGRVTLRANAAEEPRPGVNIEVEDTGVGMSEEQRQQIFDRFYHKASSAGGGEDSNYREGLGIGLALTRQLVQRHEGEITVESEPGEGTRFSIFLPRTYRPAGEVVPDQIEDGGEAQAEGGTENLLSEEVEQEADDEKDVRGPEPASDSARILVVDDNASMREYIRDILEPEFETVRVNDGRQALEKLRNATFELVVADVMMPRMDGFTLAERCMEDERFSDIPFIFVTARAGEQEQLQGLRIGVNDYLVKPFLPEELAIRARNLIRNYRSRREPVKVEAVDESEADTGGGPNAPVEELRQKVEEHIGNPNLTVDQLADELNTSKRQLYRELKSETGFTPAQFIKEVRLQQARYLLERGTNMRVSELSEAVGYGKPSYFSQQFKERFGKAPSKFG